MTYLNFAPKPLLASMGTAALLGAAMVGLVAALQIDAQAPQRTAERSPSFEVASIKPERNAGLHRVWGVLPERFTAKNVTIEMLIAYAYDVRDSQIAGGPSWINSEAYDVVAKVEDSVAEKFRELPWEQYREQYGLMVKTLLADRFKLQVSPKTKDLPVFALVVAKNGPKLRASKGPPPGPGPKRGPWMNLGKGQLTSFGMSMAALADALSKQPELGGRKVLDQTGLKGNYDIWLQWSPEQAQDGMFTATDGSSSGPDKAPPSDSSGPSIFTAVQEQLGLKLESTKGPVECIVIEHIERPTEN